MRRDGKLLGQIAKEEVTRVPAWRRWSRFFAINDHPPRGAGAGRRDALRAQPWGLFTPVDDDSDCVFMGLWMNNIRPAKRPRRLFIGIALLLLALVGGQWVSQSATWGPAFTWSGTSLSWAVMDGLHRVGAAGLAAAPRDYLSAFMIVPTFMNADR